MNIKRIAALAALSAIVSTVAPAMAASNTGNVTVDWNTQAPTQLVLTTQDTTASQTHAASENIYWAGTAGGVSGCNSVIAPATGAAGTDTSANGTVNFGNVTPEVTAGAYTGCLEPNALEAYVTSGDSKGIKLAYTLTGTPASYGNAVGADLCLITQAAYANTMAWAASSRVAAILPTSTANACPSGGGTSVSTALTTVANTALFTGTAAPAPAMDVNWDMELELSANAPTAGSPVSATLTITASAN